MGIENTELSRRQFLGGLKALVPFSWVGDVINERELSASSKASLALDLATIPWLAAACGSSPSRQPNQVPPPTGRIAPLASPTQARPTEGQSPTEVSLDGRKKLVEEIDALPASPIEKLLKERVRPFYVEGSMATRNYGGVEISILQPTVEQFTVNETTISGTFRPGPEKGFSSVKDWKGPSFLTSPTTTKQFPYPALVLAGEKSKFPPDAFYNDDNTMWLDFTWSSRVEFPGALRPEITITAPNPDTFSNPNQRERFRIATRYAFIKEVCSHLMLDLYLEEVMNKMSSRGLNPNIEVLRPDGSRGTVETLSRYLSDIYAYQGRFVACLDIAAYLLAFKAVEKTDINNPPLLDNEDLRRARPKMEVVNIGDTPHDILYRSFEWAISTPEGNLLPHGVSKLDVFP